MTGPAETGSRAIERLVLRRELFAQILRSSEKTVYGQKFDFLAGGFC